LLRKIFKELPIIFWVETILAENEKKYEGKDTTFRMSPAWSREKTLESPRGV